MLGYISHKYITMKGENRVCYEITWREEVVPNWGIARRFRLNDEQYWELVEACGGTLAWVGETYKFHSQEDVEKFIVALKLMR